MKKLITKIAVAVAGFSGVLMAQQDPQFTQFMHSRLIYNPGYAGTSDAICANILYRQQWTNFPGAPKTGLFSFDMPVGKLPMGIGLNFMNDQIGPIKSNFVRLALSFVYKGLGGGNLGIGIDGGLLQLQQNHDWIVPEPGKVDGSIPGSYTSGSSAVDNPALNKMTYDLGAGIFYQIPNKMYVGLSSTHLTAQDLKSSANPKFEVARHYYVVAGYQLALNPDNAIPVNIKVKSDAATTQLDLNLCYMYRNMVWLGVTYRMQDAIAPMLGVKLLKNKNLKIGYSYDYTLSKIKGYTSGTHEIMIGYCHGISGPKPQTVTGNVRFLD